MVRGEEGGGCCILCISLVIKGDRWEAAIADIEKRLILEHQLSKRTAADSLVQSRGHQEFAPSRLKSRGKRNDAGSDGNKEMRGAHNSLWVKVD